MEKQIGVKDFKGKLRWSLLPWRALEGCVRVLMYGAITKYVPNNWKRVKEKGTYLDAITRHLVEYSEGEEFDKETGESHLSHILCDVLFLEYDRMYRGDISFEEYVEELKLYPDYKKSVTQEYLDSKEYMKETV